MLNELSGNNTQPWYRQFWPWFLISLPAAVVIAGFITLYIAHKHSDDLVVDEYYRVGLSINQQLEKKQRAVALGVSATLAFFQSEPTHSVEVRLDGFDGQGELKLLLSHPLESDRDFVILLHRIEPSIYSGEFAGTIAARWHWILDFSGASNWRLDGSIQQGDLSNESFQ